MSKFRSNVDLQKNELQRAVLHHLPVSPSDPTEGQMYYDEGKHTAYIWNGSYWAVWGGIWNEPTGPEFKQFTVNLPYPTDSSAFVFVRLCEDYDVVRIDAAIDVGDLLNFQISRMSIIGEEAIPLTAEPITATITGTEVATFEDSFIQKDNWLFLQVIEIIGDVGMLTITMTCKKV